MNPPPVPPHSDYYKASVAASGAVQAVHRSAGGSQTPDRQLPRNPPGPQGARRNQGLPAPPQQHHHHAQASLPAGQHVASRSVQDSAAGEWESREDARRRELEEVKARAAQMEKTMRWWSDCTANWREKWSKVRSERNQARDECRQLRAHLEQATKELMSLHRTQEEVTDELKNVRLERDSLRSVVSESESNRLKCDSLADLQKALETEEILKPLSITELRVDRDSDNNDEEIVTTPSGDDLKDTKTFLPRENDVNLNKGNELSTSINADILDSKKFEEFEKIQQQLEIEKSEKEKLNTKLEKLQIDLNSLTEQLDEAVRSKNEASLEIGKLRKWKAERMEEMASDLEEDSAPTSDTSADRVNKLSNLRKELERLQAENASEWATRERLETEKQSLERENRRLRGEVDHLEEELSRRGRGQSTGRSQETEDGKTSSQDELNIKELAELRHANAKLKKCIQDKTGELDHARSRAEHYEIEVKKLRGRIEELKQDLSKIEYETDRSTSQMRKLERENDDLQQQIEGLNVQLQHLNNRLPRSPSTVENGSRTNLNESSADISADLPADKPSSSPEKSDVPVATSPATATENLPNQEKENTKENTNVIELKQDTAKPVDREPEKEQANEKQETEGSSNKNNESSST